MNLISLAQNDAFFLHHSIDYLLRRVGDGNKFAACVLFNA